MILSNLCNKPLADGRRRLDKPAPQIKGVFPKLEKVFEDLFLPTESGAVASTSEVFCFVSRELGVSSRTFASWASCVFSAATLRSFDRFLSRPASLAASFASGKILAT